MTCSFFEEAGEYSFANIGKRCIVLQGKSIKFSTVSFQKGKYRIELWGSSSGYLNRPSGGYIKTNGKGGYVSAIINLLSTTKLYFYIGTSGTNSSDGTKGTGGYNGGADGGTDNVNQDCASPGSGGATDVRMREGDLYSRIMVAGAGGSSGCGSGGGNAGDAGGLVGFKGKSNNAGNNEGGLGGNQTNGYKLGQGEQGDDGNEAAGSGGGGYFGGFRGKRGGADGGGGGGGGSSYIASFYQLESKIVEILKPIMLDGSSSMPSLSTTKEIGHIGNGIARITKVRIADTCYHKHQTRHTFLIYIMIATK